MLLKTATLHGIRGLRPVLQHFRPVNRTVLALSGQCCIAIEKVTLLILYLPFYALRTSIRPICFSVIMYSPLLQIMLIWLIMLASEHRFHLVENDYNNLAVYAVQVKKKKWGQ